MGDIPLPADKKPFQWTDGLVVLSGVRGYGLRWVGLQANLIRIFELNSDLLSGFSDFSISSWSSIVPVDTPTLNSYLLAMDTYVKYNIFELLGCPQSAFARRPVYLCGQSWQLPL